MKIKEWYLEAYPTDELGTEINPNSHFGELWAAIRSDSFYQYIINCATNLAVHQGMDPLMYKLELTHIWVNRLFTNGYHGRHSHGRSHYSGTYYVNSPTEASRIRFYHPFSDLVQHDFPKVSKIGTSLLSEYVDYDPTPGTMLIWNSWLYHEVLPNKSAEPRDSISFNLSCVPNA